MNNNQNRFQASCHWAVLALMLLWRVESHAQIASSDSSADGILLNGIAAIFDDRRAFFTRPGIPTETFSLTEGHSAHGIKLLAVDPKQNTVRIAVNGQTQTIHICATPTLIDNRGTATAAAEKFSDASSVSVLANGENSLVAAAGNNSPSGYLASSDYSLLAGGGELSSTAASRHNPYNDPTPATSDSSVATASAAVNIPPPPPLNGQPLWLVMSQYFENVRALTASQVAAGTADPVPLTPLTPSGTSPALIGSSRVFFNH